MKQLIIIAVLVILIPVIVVNFFSVKEEKIITGIVSNTNVRVKRDKTGIIETVPLEEYVLGVVAGEMPINFHEEALKAQAVAARTYVLKRIEYNKAKDYDVVDTVLNQVYLDLETLKTRWAKKFKENYKKLYNVVVSTKGEYLEYNGKIIDAMFFSTSNGYTENSEEIFSADLPYLRSVESKWDSETSPVFEDYETFTLKDFYSRLNLKFNEKLSIKITKKTSTGRAISLNINGTEMTAKDFYTKLSLRSTDFDISRDQDKVLIKTKGFGHGVGMSQYGAFGMAKKGYSYVDIVKYYYQDVSIKIIK